MGATEKGIQATQAAKEAMQATGGFEDIIEEIEKTPVALGGLTIKRGVGKITDFPKALFAGTMGIAGDIMELGHALGIAPKNPFMSTEDIKGEMGVEDGLTSFAGEMASPLPNEALAGAKLMGKALQPEVISQLLDKSPLLAQALFHGTPHKFSKFELEKIGTGEGAQAYGHGLYFAESPGVAKSYQQSTNPAYADVLRYAGPDHNRQAASLLAADIPDDQVIEGLKITGAADPQASLKEGKKILADANASGHLYEVDIPDETIAKMLDWDAPLSEQPESVRKALDKMAEPWDDVGSYVFNRLADESQLHRGVESFYDELADLLGGEEAASKALNEAGIPGIRFFDGQSRGKAALGQTIGAREKKLLQQMVKAEDAGDTALVTKLQKQLDNLEDDVTGTRNIVVFNPDDIKTVKRDGELVYDTGKKGGLLGGSQALSKQEFLDKFDMHTDLRGRDAGNAAENAQKIMEEGFKSGGLNRVPVSMADPSLKGMAGQYRPKTGDYVYLIPSKVKGKSGSGRPAIPAGWKPGGKDGGMLVRLEEGEELYDAYIRALRDGELVYKQ